MENFALKWDDGVAYNMISKLKLHFELKIVQDMKTRQTEIDDFL